jgi:HrpA-like RNA helicase
VSGVFVCAAGALDESEKLTPLGVYLAQLPVDARLGKLLVTSVFMCCLSDALTIAACLSYKTPFSTAFAVRTLCLLLFFLQAFWSDAAC